MTCRDVDDLIEAVVAGDAPADEAFRAHLEGCLRCASAVATARQVEAALAARPMPSAPAAFTAGVLARIRRERWRSEEQVDRLFNTALVSGVLLIAAGIVAMLNVSGIAGLLSSGVRLVNELGSRVLVEAAPAASMYLAAGSFLVTAVLVWWWAEQRFSL